MHGKLRNSENQHGKVDTEENLSLVEGSFQIASCLAAKLSPGAIRRGKILLVGLVVSPSVVKDCGSH